MSIQLLNRVAAALAVAIFSTFGGAAIAAEDELPELFEHCDGRIDSFTGLQFPEWDNSDPSYTIRAWQTVVFAFLVDHKFVLE